ncbi:kinase-like domain-containing protein [Halteromyces radiatus]|uniref:kinase-like domain-containing protein n=1 Tax=Halteromyces radiatus TaxID=101107 RepID=UPI00221F8B45|nr:kinase-like domain-containing protein [Halteromyces radiatus]KAI8076764.1 kinase-like domain-containing protein [Halteromyces radiatus]
MLDAMKAYIRQTSRMATLRYCQHYDLSFEECRALLHVPRVTESVAIKQELDRKYDHQEPPRHQSIIQPDQYQDISQQDLLFLQESPVINQQTHSKPLEHRSMIQSLERFELEQQENIDTREQEPIIISVPLAYEDKQSLVVSQLMNDTTYDLVNSVSQNSLRILKRKPLIPFTSQGLPFSLGQEMIDVHGYLDEGKYGTVYVVKWRNRPMALKIHKQVDRWEHYMHQFIYQQCPQADRFFLRSHALYLDHHHSYSIMDYASQGTLLKCLNVFRQLDERAVPEALVQLLVLRILQAIYVLHEAHIVHLDLKLDNLLMDYSLPGMAPTQQNNHNNNTFLGPVPAYTSSHPFWQNISIKVIDFGLALNLDLFNNATRTPILAKAVWKPRVKNDMPSIVAGLPWLPYQLDYWGIANCAHSLLFSGPMVNAKHNQPKRYWNQSLWLSFFTSLASSPPSTLDMGLQTFRKLINDFEVSLATGNLKDRVINDLLKYHQYLTKVK